MPVKRNHGRKLGPRPLLLDRAVKARPARVNRRRKFPVTSLTFTLLLAIGGVYVYRTASPESLNSLLKAASAKPIPATQPSSKLNLPPVNLPDFLTPSSGTPAHNGPATHPSPTSPDAWKILTAPTPLPAVPPALPSLTPPPPINPTITPH